MGKHNRRRYSSYTGGRRSVSILPLDELNRDVLSRSFNNVFGFRNAFLSQLRHMSVTDTTLRSYLLLGRNGVIGDVPISPAFNKVGKKKHKDMLRDLWAEFECAPTCDGIISYRQMLTAAVEQYLTDGRLFFMTKYHSDYPQGIALLPLAREVLADVKDGEHQGNRVAWGEEYSSESGRLTAYHMYKEGMTPAQWGRALMGSNVGAVGGEVVRVPRERVHDLAFWGRLDNYSNHASPLIAAVYMLTQVGMLDKATIKTLQAAACKMGFYITHPDAPVDNAESSEEVDYDDEDDDRYARPNRLSHGDIIELPHGKTFAKFDPASPNTNVTDYRIALLRLACGSMGADYNSVASDANKTTYSTMRQFGLQTRDTWRALQGDIKERLVRPFLKQWLENHQMRGTLPNLSKADMRAACMSRLDTRTFPWIDPAKDAAARVALMKSGALSPQDLAAESGKSFDDVMLEWAEAGEMILKDSEGKIAAAMALLGQYKGDDPASKQAADDEKKGKNGGDGGGAGE